MTNKGTILVAAESPASAKEMADLLTAEGYQVRSAGSGAAALAPVAAGAPELIVLDLSRPELNGLEACRRLKARAESRDIPVILISTSLDARERVAGLEAGAADILIKPFCKEELLARVRTQMELQQLRARLEQQAFVLRTANELLQNEVADRKRMEAAMAQERDQLQSLMNSIPDTIYFKDRQSRFLKVNEAFAHRQDLSGPADALGKSDSEIFGKEHSRRAWEDEQRMMTTGEALIGIEEEEASSDGRVTWVSTTKVPLRGTDGEITGMVGISRDITKRRRAEELLRQSEARYRSLFEHMLDGFAYCRMLFEQDRPEDFIYLEVNDAFTELTGLTDVVGKRVTEVVHGIRESNPQLFEIYGRVASTGRPERFEQYIPPLKIWLAVSVYSAGKELFVAIFDNITVRKLAEAALRESESRHRLLFENSPQPMYAYDANTLAFLAVNDAAIRQYGYSRDEFLAMTLEGIRPAEEVPALHDALSEMRFHEVSDRVWRHQKKDGALIWAQVSSRATVFGGRSCRLALATDITARKQTEAERDRLIAELQAALADVKTLSGIIPICCGCKKIRDDTGYWNQVESYVAKHSLAKFSHGYCPDCIQVYFGDYLDAPKA